MERDDQREKVKEEKRRLSTEKDVSLVSQKEQEVETGREEEQMEVTEEGQSDRERAERGEEKKIAEEEEEGETAMDQSENLTSQILHQYQNTDPIPKCDTVKDSSVEAKPVPGLISAPVPVQTPASVPAPAPAPAPEVSLQSQRLPESHRDLQPVSQEDFCENMSTHSDNQSGTFNHTPVDPTHVHL